MRLLSFLFKILIIAVVFMLLLVVIWIVLSHSYLDLPSELPPIILTSIGTIAAFLSGRYLFEEFKKPYLKIIRFDKLISSDRETFWRIKVENTGRSGAENCCGDIELTGRFSNNDELRIEGRVSWARIGNPESLTVNSGDTQFLNVMRTIYHANGNLDYVQFPSENGYASPRRKLRKTNGDWEMLDVMISRHEIQNGEWNNLIKITSCNGAVVKRKFCWEIVDNKLKPNLKDC